MSFSFFCRLVAVSTCACIFQPVAIADSGKNAVPLLPKYKQECAACHTAYQPGMLPAASWQRLMGGLHRHHGTDASLDPSDVREISAWLNANAGTFRGARDEPPEDRITKSEWFVRKHNAREIAPTVWKRAAIGSPSNCQACHTNAEQGKFNERDIRIPK
ncbi:MAG: cytochrome C [Burkholderiales bacterium PBB3]|nr:MAG: cytochrome C [Burkholderiales bacterium PBB3]